MKITITSNRCLAASFILLLALDPGTSFLPVTLSSKKNNPFCSSPLTVLRDQESSSQEIEEARRVFERLASFQFEYDRDPTKPPSMRPFPMTSNVERLRKAEFKLLEALEDSDSAINPLVELWVRERQDASKALVEMSSSPFVDIDREEHILRQMIDDYGDDGWIEPHGRLAVLLMARGCFDEVLELCDYCLYVKPWHFEVAQLMAVAFLKVGDWVSAVRVTRDAVLPPLCHPKRRKKWVKRMTEIAKRRLDQAQAISVTATIDTAVTEECYVDEDSNCWQ